MNTRALRGSILIVLMGLSVAFTIRADAQQQPTAIPAAPNGLKYYVNGSLVALEWSVNSNDNTSFIIEAGGTPGTTFFSFSTLALANPGFLTQMIPNFSASAPSGNYFVRVHAANAEGRSVASNEILVPITGGCQVPGPPTEFNAIVRGNFGMLQWYPGQGGVQSFYVLEARQAPAGPIIAAFQTTTNFFNVNGIPNGTFYVTIRAVNACGSSAPSAQITVVAPSNTPEAKSRQWQSPAASVRGRHRGGCGGAKPQSVYQRVVPESQRSVHHQPVPESGGRYAADLRYAVRLQLEADPRPGRERRAAGGGGG
jgi:hypothetical protein